MSNFGDNLRSTLSQVIDETDKARDRLAQLVGPIYRDESSLSEHLTRKRIRLLGEIENAIQRFLAREND